MQCNNNANGKIISATTNKFKMHELTIVCTARICRWTQQAQPVRAQHEAVYLVVTVRIKPTTRHELGIYANCKKIVVMP